MHSALIAEDAPTWRFAPLADNQVSADVTQRDDFNNESVELHDALVREAIQNSIDAVPTSGSAKSTSVRVRFALYDLEGPEASVFASLMGSLEPHFRACEFGVGVLAQDICRVLVVEDFGTTGLTGSQGSYDDGNFDKFWRTHGGSAKDPAKLGSHGLGKLVFPASSQAGALFGLSVTADGPTNLFGCSVLNTHRIDGQRMPAHGYWTNTDVATGNILLPDTDASRVSAARALFRFKRQDEPGFSICVPYADEGITVDGIIEAVVRNYFPTLLAGDLEVEVSGQLINKDTFWEVVKAAPRFDHDSLAQFEFAQAVLKRRGGDPDFELPTRIFSGRIEEGHISDADAQALADKVATGEIVQVRASFNVHKIGQSEPKAALVDYFLAQVPVGCRKWSMFLRDSIVLTAERSFAENAYGAMVPVNKAAKEIIRAAENPSHTKLSGRDKLRGWSAGVSKVRDIRLSLKSLYKLLFGEHGSVNEDLLIHLLSIPSAKTAPGKGKKTKVKPSIPPPVRPRHFALSRIDGGFKLSASADASIFKTKQYIHLRVAYDVLSGNPFKLHRPMDFDFTKGQLIESIQGATIIKRAAGKLIIEVEEEDFRVEVTGFDKSRDLKVEPRVVL